MQAVYKERCSQEVEKNCGIAYKEAEQWRE